MWPPTVYPLLSPIYRLFCRQLPFAWTPNVQSPALPEVNRPKVARCGPISPITSLLLLSPARKPASLLAPVKSSHVILLDAHGYCVWLRMRPDNNISAGLVNLRRSATPVGRLGDLKLPEQQPHSLLEHGEGFESKPALRAKSLYLQAAPPAIHRLRCLLYPRMLAADLGP